MFTHQLGSAGHLCWVFTLGSLVELLKGTVTKLSTLELQQVQPPKMVGVTWYLDGYNHFCGQWLLMQVNRSHTWLSWMHLVLERPQLPTSSNYSCYLSFWWIKRGRIDFFFMRLAFPHFKHGSDISILDIGNGPFVLFPHLNASLWFAGRSLCITQYNVTTERQTQWAITMTNMSH